MHCVFSPPLSLPLSLYLSLTHTHTIPRDTLASALIHCITAAPLTHTSTTTTTTTTKTTHTASNTHPSLSPLMVACVATGCIDLPVAVRQVSTEETLDIQHKAAWLQVLLGNDRGVYCTDDDDGMCDGGVNDDGDGGGMIMVCTMVYCVGCGGCVHALAVYAHIFCIHSHMLCFTYTHMHVPFQPTTPLSHTPSHTITAYALHAALYAAQRSIPLDVHYTALSALTTPLIQPQQPHPPVSSTPLTHTPHLQSTNYFATSTNHAMRRILLLALRGVVSCVAHGVLWDRVQVQQFHSWLTRDMLTVVMHGDDDGGGGGQDVLWSRYETRGEGCIRTLHLPTITRSTCSHHNHQHPLPSRHTHTLTHTQGACIRSCNRQHPHPCVPTHHTPPTHHIDHRA